MKVNPKNERTKKQFFKWLKEAGRCCDATVSTVEKAILIYEDFTKADDFAHYHPDKAVQFKNWLKARTFRGRQIALTTCASYIRHLKKFFLWLYQQPGYKSRIKPTDIDYLSLTEKEERVAAQGTPRQFPAIEYVLNLSHSITITSEIDQRDRALIAFTLLSGMRDSAIASLPIGCFDEGKLVIDQNPRKGVKTKFSKLIVTPLFQFDMELVAYILDWVKHLENNGFGSQDPLFPRSKVIQGENGNLSFEKAREVEPVYWESAGRIREIFKRRAREANLPYFPPHTFRHLAVHLALKSCRSAEELQAISQSFGHEYVATTLAVYGNPQPDKLLQIIQSIDFANKKDPLSDEVIEAAAKIILANKNKTL